MAHDVFISHSAKDKPVADAICAALEREGVRCWIAPRDILPGVAWGGAIIDGINDSRAMVLVYSSNANESPQILREVERAVNRGIPVIPFRIQDVSPSRDLEFYIMSQHWLDALTPPLEAHIARLANTVKRLIQPEESESHIMPGGDSGAGAAGVHKNKPGPGSSKKLIYAGAAAALVLAGLIVYFITRPGGRDVEKKTVTETEERTTGVKKLAPGEMYGALYGKCYTDALCVESACRAEYPGPIESELCVAEFWSKYTAENGPQIVSTVVPPSKVNDIYNKCGDDVVCFMNECKNKRTSWTENFVCFTKVLEKIARDRAAINSVALDGAIIDRIRSECGTDTFLCVSRICKDTVGIHFTQYLACTERGMAAVK